MTDKILIATHGSEKTPLRIGDLEIPCYVLEDGTRVLSQRGVNKALSVPQGGGDLGGRKIPRFLAQSPLKAFISAELSAGVSKPIRYTPPHGGNPATGIPKDLILTTPPALPALPALPQNEGMAGFFIFQNQSFILLMPYLPYL